MKPDYVLFTKDTRPYTFRKVSRVFSTYEILFEETVVLNVSFLQYEDVAKIVLLLNTAYELGYNSGTLIQSMQDAKERDSAKD